MGTLKNHQTGEIVILHAHHQFGRGLQNQTRLTESCISRSHSIIRWEESEWQILDCSKNGTILDGRYFYHATKKLGLGSKIQFGKEGYSVWEMMDDSQPASYLKSTSNPNIILDLEKQSVLPNPEDPRICFFKTGLNNWHADTKEETIDLLHGNTYTFLNEEWLFVENECLESTADHINLINQSYFLFAISPDEEDVNVKIVVNDLELELGKCVYNHILFKLAQQRVNDESNGCETHQAGWVSMEEMTVYLSKELLKEIDHYYLNIQIYRLRNKVMELKPYGYLFSKIIERRKGELRFNHPHVRFTKARKKIARIQVPSKERMYN